MDEGRSQKIKLESDAEVKSHGTLGAKAESLDFILIARGGHGKI